MKKEELTRSLVCMNKSLLLTIYVNVRGTIFFGCCLDYDNNDSYDYHDKDYKNSYDHHHHLRRERKQF